MIIYCGNGVIFSVSRITIASNTGRVESHPWKNRIIFHFSEGTNVNNRVFQIMERSAVFPVHGEHILHEKIPKWFALPRYPPRYCYDFVIADVHE